MASWTYFAADAAYYLDKRERGFDRVVIMLGADHHGYVGRYKALAAAFGDDPDVNLEILHRPDGQPVQGRQAAADEQARRHHRDPRRARRGDRCRRRPLRARPLLDATARSTSTSTRGPSAPTTTRSSTCSTRTPGSSSLLRNAAELGLDVGDPDAFHPELLDHEREGDLLGALGEFPRVVATAAELREPHRVARYLEELAGTYHRFYDACRVLPRGDEEVTDLHRARLWLVEATRIVLANGLRLLGVSAPERM